MATAIEYKKYVTKNHQRGMVSVKGMTFQNSFNDLITPPIFERRDNGRNWDMRQVACDCSGNIFLEVGWLQADNSPDIDIDPYLEKNMINKYWWCREANWLPYWGKETKKRANLMKDIRNYWLNKWFSKIVPEIKKTLLETTPIPEDIVNFLPEYFEYPYQTKLW